MTKLDILITISLLLATLVTAHGQVTPRHAATKPSGRSAFTFLGCYRVGAIASIQSSARTHAFNSVGSCIARCQSEDRAIAAMRSSECVCSDVYPAFAASTAVKSCDVPCPGYAMEICGGRETYSVYKLGRETDAEHPDEGKESIASSDTELTKVSDASYGFVHAANDLLNSLQNFLGYCLGNRGSRGTKQQAATAHMRLLGVETGKFN
ncbi:hypothetical protein S40285_05426 [Stachybotrys chlorohalonatus IBT 40285]|uniref:WSC domain-containing protein n=1 Tax=Stachybotrys chlorohalonatus (strain IBT 40285) TaxID=1283841 RepID=A0A084QY96_STAC4|nr:hypothetical protein S40285_05426 [Stachybotrys chlorohalonata IBT 40285]